MSKWRKTFNKTENREFQKVQESRSLWPPSPSATQNWPVVAMGTLGTVDTEASTLQNSDPW